jgi:malate dehydrogenase (oxaloacetate-decarboxylating)
MMLAAAKALGDQSPALKDPAASLLPNVRTIRDIAREVAYAVAVQANNEGLAPEFGPEKGRQMVAENQWTPEYSVYAV